DLRRVVAEKADPHRAQLFVDVRVVDDLACQVDRAIRKPLARLVCVVDRAVDAVTEAELAREMDSEPAGPVAEDVGLDSTDEAAVIVLRQPAGAGILEAEALPEDERRQTLIVRSRRRRGRGA